MDWQEMKETFSGLVSKSSGGLISTKKEIFNSDSQIRILLGEEQHLGLLKDGEKTCFLDYFIDRRKYTKETIGQLLQSIPDRDYEKLTYYCSEHIKQRNRITTKEELNRDLKCFLNIICDIQTNNNESTLNSITAVSIANDISALDLLEKKIWTLLIPQYQRPYSWTEKNVKEFLYGIAKWQEEKDSTIFHMGTIILCERENGVEIVDGQQRLTTLAIWSFVKEHSDSTLLINSKNYKEEEIQTILRTKRLVDSLDLKIDLNKIIFSVVVLEKNAPQDLAYTFFSNNNTTGKRLTDYELLKTHHLRYLPSDKSKESEIFSKKWHAIEKTGYQDDLLQKMLFRLRNWNNSVSFAFESSNTDSHDVFNHFKSIDALPGYPVCNQTSFRFNSKLSGGREFFVYAEYYHQKYKEFIMLDTIRKMESHLNQHSNGVICAGIKSIAFLFYCKFGSIYLNDAVYLLSYTISKLRNNYSIKRDILGKNDDSIFLKTTQDLDQVTSEAQFFAILNSFSKKYQISNVGPTARNYWRSLKELLQDLEETLFDKTIVISRDFFKPLEAEERN